MGVTRPRRFPSVARSGAAVNPEFLAKTGKNSPCCDLRNRRLGRRLPEYGIAGAFPVNATTFAFMYESANRSSLPTSGMA